jgi:hypothetical protein
LLDGVVRSNAFLTNKKEAEGGPWFIRYSRLSNVPMAAKDPDPITILRDRSTSVFRLALISGVISLVSIGLVVALFFKIGWLRINPAGATLNTALIGYFLLSAVFGALVGASEIVSRYRDEPYIALGSSAGRWYMMLNGAISAAAFGLLVHYQGQLFASLKQDLLMTSFVAGFGAMVVMRSKLFSFKTEGGENFSIGPEAVLVIFLSSVDRQIDRYRASRRQQLVFEEAMGIKDPGSAPGFLRAFLVSYQNLTNDEKGKINAGITDVYANADLPTPMLKLMAVAFAFLNIMGEKNFTALIANLKKYQDQTTSQSDESPDTPIPPI